MTIKQFLIPLILGAIVSCALTRYYWPQISTQTVVKTRVEYRNRTITRIKERKDGSKVTVIDSTTDQNSASNSTSTVYKAPQWRVGLLAAIPTASDSRITRPARYMPQYGMEVQKRVAGPLYAGVLYIHPYIGMQIGLEF